MIRVKDYDEALERRERHRSSACPSGICTTSLKHAGHFKRNAEAGMVMVNLPTAGVDYHVPVRRPEGLELRPARAGALRAGVLHDGEDRLHVRHERTLRAEDKGKSIAKALACVRANVKGD